MERPSKIPKDVLPYVEYLEAELKKYTETDYADGYLSLLAFTKNSNEQIRKNKIDLFGDATQKEFDRGHKYLTEMLPYYENMAKLRALMNPEQVKQLDEKIEQEGLAPAIKIALKHLEKNGKGSSL